MKAVVFTGPDFRAYGGAGPNAWSRRSRTRDQSVGDVVATTNIGRLEEN